MKSFLAGLLLFTMSLGAVAQTPPPPPLTLGGLFNLSGRQAELDVPASRGAQLAVDQANSSGGVLGRAVQLVTLDGESNLEGVVQKTREMLAFHPRLSAVFGFSDTDFVLATAPLTAKQNLPFVTSGATSPRLPAEVPGCFYMACFGDNVQAAAAAEFAAKDLKGKKAVILYDETTEYTRLLQQYFTTRFRELGGEIIAGQSFTPDRADRLPLEAARADVIFLAAGPQEALVGVRRLRQLGLDTPVVGGDAFDSSVWASAPEIENVYFTTHAFLGESNRKAEVVKFRQEYLAKYPGTVPDAFAALGYDTANLLIETAKQANSTDPKLLCEALDKIEGFKGVTGTISFPGESRIPTKSVSLIRVAKGKMSLVREVLPAQVPAP